MIATSNMNIDDFLSLSAQQKSFLLMYTGDLPDNTDNSKYLYRLYFYKKFYFEEIIDRTTNKVVATNMVQKFAHFKKYLLAIRAKN